MSLDIVYELDKLELELNEQILLLHLCYFWCIFCNPHNKYFNRELPDPGDDMDAQLLKHVNEPVLVHLVIYHDTVEAGDDPDVSGKSAKRYGVKSANLYEEKYSSVLT